jgi:predicted enzyme related to lactoylglutathione lyase
MRMDGQIDFVEFPGQDLVGMRHFYGRAFGWTFEDRGGAYVAFQGAGVQGGFSADPASAPAEPLVVFYARDLEVARDKVRWAGGEITRDIFVASGGRRFHFRDPGENEVAVWSDQARTPFRALMRAPRPQPRPQVEAKPAFAFAFWRNWDCRPARARQAA